MGARRPRRLVDGHPRPVRYPPSPRDSMALSGHFSQRLLTLGDHAKVEVLREAPDHRPGSNIRQPIGNQFPSYEGGAGDPKPSPPPDNAVNAAPWTLA